MWSFLLAVLRISLQPRPHGVTRKYGLLSGTRGVLRNGKLTDLPLVFG
jgi:hypothetical protein